ncbi:MAG: hypothetical protein JST42_27645 [Bacteroidetes bacterium]|nr:hypothetical protein [Bacteroidota bacterium]
MKFFRLALFTLVIFFITTGLIAQQFGGNPPSLKWKQLNTDTARIIFPAGLDSAAQQVAAIVHMLSRTTHHTVGQTQRKIDIVLQNQTTIANGYVGLAPFRSEFLLTPEQNSFELGSLPWTKMLSIHEYRHVQQYNNFRVGLSGAFYYLFGEGGQAFANGLSVPNWFWEGDAVYQETLVSNQGRGRQPWFFNSYRSLRAGDRHYSWMKLRNGSLRDYVPDHYPLGYMLIAYGRERYGDGFWRKVGHDAAAFHGLFYPLQRAIKRYAGVSFGQYRRDALAWFGVSPALKDATPAARPSPAFEAEADAFARTHRHFVANEEFPQLIGSDSILYISSSYRRIPSFVIRDLHNKNTTKIKTRAVSLDNYFSLNNGRAVYAAYETDPRWGWRDYSVIRVLDPTTGEDRRLTRRSRYFSPDISTDGQRIVAVQEAADGSCALHLLDAATGSLLTQIPNRDSLFYTYPKFYADNTIVTAVRNRRGQMSLAAISIDNGEPHYLLPFSWQTIGFPSVRGDTIYFSASRDGQDRTYALAAGRLFRVTLPHGDPLTGQYQLQGSANGELVWNTFTAVGFHLDTAARSELGVEEIPVSQWSQPLPLQNIDSLRRGPAGLLDRITTANYPASRYSLGSHLINFHSWRPYINDPDYTFSLVSDNILNTLETQLFVAYNRNENFKQAGATASYAGWYPWLDAGWTYTFDRNAFYGSNKVYWNENEFRAGLSVPLSWTSGRHFTNLQFGSDIVRNQRYYTGLYKDSFNTRAFAYITPFVSLVHQSQQAQQQIYPRWAQVLSLSYDRAVTSFQANQFLASGFLYLPGIDYTHSLLLTAAFQQRDSLRNARFSNSFPFSRGYSGENFYQMWKWSANYQLPLVHPDWGFGNIVYFLRLRANLFYDYTHAKDFYTNGGVYNADFRSYGTELYFDTKWWNELAISFGIRYSHLLDQDFEGRGPNQWELILPLNLLSQGYSARSIKAVN